MPRSQTMPLPTPPAFWVQDMHFLDGDFRQNPKLEAFFTSQQQADKLYSSTSLAQPYRYGLRQALSRTVITLIGFTTILITCFRPRRLSLGAIWIHCWTFTPSRSQPPTRVTATAWCVFQAQQPSWIPTDAGLVDHMFLLFGLVESIDPDFFTSYMIPELVQGDYNADGVVDQADYTYWRANFASLNRLAADGSDNNQIDAADYVIWRKHVGDSGLGTSVSVPEPSVFVSILSIPGVLVVRGSRRRRKA